jgi:nicotinamidase-related amidase
MPSHSAFAFTPLDRILRNCGVETCIVMGGTVTDAIDDTVRQGAAYGYRMLIVVDAVFPPSSDHLSSLSTRADFLETDEVARLISLDAIPRTLPVGFRPLVRTGVWNGR